MTFEEENTVEPLYIVVLLIITFFVIIWLLRSDCLDCVLWLVHKTISSSWEFGIVIKWY